MRRRSTYSRSTARVCYYPSMASVRPLIAVVDDEDAVRRALARLLRASDFDVETYASGAKFLESLAVRLPDCVVLDMQMDELTGADVLRHLQAARVALPLIVITAFDEPGMRERCLAAGACDFLRKPVLSDVLLAAIEKALHRPS